MFLGQIKNAGHLIGSTHMSLLTEEIPTMHRSTNMSMFTKGNSINAAVYKCGTVNHLFLLRAAPLLPYRIIVQ